MSFTAFVVAVAIGPAATMQPIQDEGMVLPRHRYEPAGPNGPFVSPSLPSTGHGTHFKHYSTGPIYSQSNPTAAGPALSPYLNFARRGTSTLADYYSFQRDSSIYNTAAQTQQINTQLKQPTETVPYRQPTQPFVQNLDVPKTPLQRRFQAQEQAAAAPGAPGAPRANSEEVLLLREMLRELKSIREGLPPRTDRKAPEKRLEEPPAPLPPPDQNPPEKQPEEAPATPTIP